MKTYKVAIIGGGIVGACIFSHLARAGVSVVLLEGSDDVAGGATKANSGIVHSGYDPTPGTLKARFNKRGNEMYGEMCARLGIEMLRTGTLTVGTKDCLEDLRKLRARGEQNGIPELEILDRNAILKLEPNVADSIEYALFAKTGAIVSPYFLCIALAEEGIINGGEVKLNFFVDKIGKDTDSYDLFCGKEFINAEYVINCAGVGAAEINKLMKDKNYTCEFAKGEYIILDSDQRSYVNRPVFPLPLKDTKGILCIPTHHNVMFGPTAVACGPFDTSVSSESLEAIKTQAAVNMKKPNFKKSIKLFAGVRVRCGDDFVIEKSKKNKNYYYTIGICSPGLTAAPAIAEYVADMLKADGLKLTSREPIKRKNYINLHNMTRKELKAIVKTDKAYGKIICRCERVTLGEIRDVLNSPLCPASIDAIKRRLRPTMGRCQGSFCISHLIKIIAKERNVPLEQVTMKGAGSELLTDNIKSGGIYE